MISISNPLRRRTRLTPEQRREQIAQAAVTIIAQYGSYGFSMQRLADAVHMTVPGLNHYVSSREEVLALVIETYYDTNTGTYTPLPDTNDGHNVSMPAYLRKLVKSNASRPEMVALFMQLAIESANPHHPAHEFYRDRHATILKDMMAIDWNLPPYYRNPEHLHDLIVTAFFAMDGVQVQAMTNPHEDMVQLWAHAERTLFPSPTWDGYR